MELSKKLISDFVNATNDASKEKPSPYVYGTVVKTSDENGVKIDGSEIVTPVISLMSSSNGDRVLVQIENHQARVIGNYSHPAENLDSSEAINKVKNIIADKVTADYIEAEIADIGYLKANDITVETGSFNYLASDKLSANIADIADAQIENATIEQAQIKDLSSDYAHITEGVIDNATIDYAKINELDAHIIDAAIVNSDVATIGALFNRVGLIDSATIKDGHITGFLDAVEVNANSITAGTLKADMLYVKDNDGKYRLLIVDSDGSQKWVEPASRINERTITADHLVAKSITSNEIDTDNLFVTGNTFMNGLLSVSSIGSTNMINNSETLIGKTTRSGTVTHPVFVNESGDIITDEAGNSFYS